MIPVQYVSDTGTWAKMEYPCILANTSNHQRWERATNNYKNEYTVRWFSVKELNFEFNLEKINSRRRRRRNILTIIWVLSEVGLFSSCKNKVVVAFKYLFSLSTKRKKIVTRMVLPSFLHLFGKRWGINGWREIGGWV